MTVADFHRNNIQKIIIHESQREQGRTDCISIKLTPNLKDVVQKICDIEGVTKSTIGNQALAFLAAFYPNHIDLMNHQFEVKSFVSRKNKER